MNELSLFNTLFGDENLGFPVFRNSGNFVPKVDVKETQKAYTIEMDLPGFSEEDVEIGLKDDVLTISSKQKAKNQETETVEEKSEEDFQWLIRERRVADFERRFSLPRDIDAQQITAQFKNGVLIISIPRKAEMSARKINISVA